MVVAWMHWGSFSALPQRSFRLFATRPDQSHQRARTGSAVLHEARSFAAAYDSRDAAYSGTNIRPTTCWAATPTGSSEGIPATWRASAAMAGASRLGAVLPL